MNENIEFKTYLKDGIIHIKPNRYPETKEEANVALFAINLYSKEYEPCKYVLDVDNFDNFINKIQNLINEKED